MPEVEVEDGVRLHYDEYGSGRVVLFLHGALASGRAFRGQLAALRETHRVLLVDQRGHGRSTHLSSEGGSTAGWDTLTVPQLAADAVAFLDHVAPRERAHFVGASLGGLVAARVASERPDRVARLALLSTPSGPDAGWRSFFASTPPEALPEATQRLARLWHGEPYWRDLARALFLHFADPPADAFAVRPKPERALVLQATADELLDERDAESWVARIDAPARVEHAPGDHAFFADGREGTRAANRALKHFLEEG